MRYVVMSLAVLLLAAAVGGQESPFYEGRSQLKDSLLIKTAEAAGDFPDPFGDVPAPGPEDPPLTEGQAVALRHGIARARDAAEALGQAAEAFKKGGNAEAAGRAFQAAQTAREVSTAVAGNLERREEAIAGGIAKLQEEMARIQAEIDRLNAELRRTREGKPGPVPDPVQQPTLGKPYER